MAVGLEVCVCVCVCVYILDIVRAQVTARADAAWAQADQRLVTSCFAFDPL